MSDRCIVPGLSRNPEDEVNPYRQEHIPWPSLADSPWPIARHDPQGTGRSQYSGPQNGEIVDTLGTGRWLNCSTVIGENNTLYMLTTGDRLIKYSDTREVVWTFDFPGLHDNHWTPVLGEGGVVYVCSQYNILYALNTGDGSIRWSTELDGIIQSNVNLDRDGNLYLKVGDNRHLVSLTPEGTVRWELDNLGVFNTGVETAVFSPDGAVLYACAGDSLFAISTLGQKLWGIYSGGEIWWPLVDNAGNIYFYNRGNKSVTSLTPEGHTRWDQSIEDLSILRVHSAIAPTMDIYGNLYMEGTLQSLEFGVFSFTNDGQYRGFWSYVRSGSDLISDGDGYLYVYHVESDNVYVKKVSSDGNIVWAIERDYTGGGPGWSPSIGSDKRAFFPYVNNSISPVIEIH